MNRRTGFIHPSAHRVGTAIVLSAACMASMSNIGAAVGPPPAEKDGTVHVPAFDLPESAFLSTETRAALQQIREDDAFQAAFKACPSTQGADRASMPAIRQCQAAAFYKTAFYRSVRDRYAVAMAPQEMRGVYTEVFTPAQGVARRNGNRVLISLHGGGFYCCARINSHLESIPIASVGRIKVISIDYRQAPEYTFPAASEDVAAVYKEVLKRYKPRNIGLYGCSSGGMLAAESIAWFQKEKLPLPGAIGMFCGAAGRALDAETGKFVKSDSWRLVGALLGDYQIPPELNYFRGVDRRNRLASPGDYDEMMAKFPPSLLISGTRDMQLSSVLVTHAQLVRLGVEADLHVWEGMSHAFHFFPALPESREAYDVIVRFFDSHLGK